MILVLAVLVMVATMALPALRGPMDDQRLRKAADLVRAQWARARVKAMKTGQMQVFRYEVGGEFYSVQPWEGQTDPLEASNDPSATSFMDGTMPQIDARNANNPLGIAGLKLPPGIKFFSGEATTDSRSLEVTANATGMDAGSGLDSGSGLSQPIIFYPDGSTTDARLVLTNERFCVQLYLRGLTGLSRGSDLSIADELGQ
jgi:Tfp pilus assembly protein FimT